MLSNFASSAVALMLAAKRAQRQSGGRQLRDHCYVTKKVGGSVFADCLLYDVIIFYEFVTYSRLRLKLQEQLSCGITNLTISSVTINREREVDRLRHCNTHNTE